MEENDETRWLTPEEQSAWMGLVGVLIRLPQALDAQLQRDHALKHFDYGVLSSLSDAPERTLRMSELAWRTEGSLQRLSQVVARLEKRGLVRRTPDPADGRYTLATLTADGWEKVVAAAPSHVDEVRRLVFDALTARQVAQVGEISRRIMQRIDPADRMIGPAD